MNIFNYDRETKEFLSTTEAIESPLEPGVFLLPAYSTSEEPLPAKNGYAICFNGVWEYVIDERGTTVYSTTTKEPAIVDYLDAIKAGYTKDVPGEFDVWDTVSETWVKDDVAEMQSMKKQLTAAIQAELDSFAASKGYDSILSACTYALSTGPFQAEGQSFIDWRDAVWTYAIGVLADVEAGTINIPTKEELIAGMPAYV